MRSPGGAGGGAGGARGGASGCAPCTGPPPEPLPQAAATAGSGASASSSGAPPFAASGAGAGGARTGFFTIEGRQQQAQREDARDVHAGLLRTEGLGPLDLAVLAKLRVWETSGDDCSLEQMMDLVRWTEAKLMPPAQPPNPWLRLFREAPIRRRVALAAGLVGALVLLLALVGAAAWVAIEASKVFHVAPDGTLIVADLTADVAGAVTLRSLRDYPSFPIEVLRRVQDVALRHEGAFHLYRVASIAQVVGGGVRLEAEDGTLLLVQGGRAARLALAPPFAPAGAAPLAPPASLAAGASWTRGGALRAVALGPT